MHSPLSVLCGFVREPAIDPAFAAIDGGNGVGTQACGMPQA
jgi:hypothetical protein